MEPDEKDTLVFEFDTEDTPADVEDTAKTVTTPSDEDDQDTTDDTDPDADANDADADDSEDDSDEPEVKTKTVDSDDDSEKEKFGNRAERRIKQLLSRVKEAEAAAEAERKRVQELEEASKTYETRTRSSQEAAIREHAKRLDSDIAAAVNAYRRAREDSDMDAEIEANDKLLTLKSEKFVIDQAIRKIENKPKDEPAKKKDEPVPPRTPEPSARALKWQETNTWFGKDRVKTAAALAIHSDLIESGIRPDIDEEEYYESLDTQLSKAFNMAPKAKKSPVAGGKRTTGAATPGKTKVTLTKQELDLAKQLGISPEAYAKQKLSVQKERG